MKSHDASCFCGVLLNTATFAPNITVAGDVVPVCGGAATLQFCGVFMAAAMNGRLDVDAKVNASLPCAKSVCQSNPVGVYAKPPSYRRFSICRTARPSLPSHATVLPSALMSLPPMERTMALKYDASDVPA